MSSLSKTLFQSTTLGTSNTTLYTCPANKRCRVDKFTVSNYSATARTVTIQIIASGASAADQYKVIVSQTIDANGSEDITELRHVLEAGDYIVALADAATAVNARGSGTEFTS